MASANVNTLSPCDDCADGPTLALTGRILALQSQFAQCGLQLVGIQEGPGPPFFVDCTTGAGLVRHFAGRSTSGQKALG